MPKYCTSCGQEMPYDAAVCGACGTEAGTRPMPSYMDESAEEEMDTVVSTGTYFGLMFLFGIPVIGFLACIIMSFLPKNKNTRHFALAQLIWSAISLLVTLLLCLLLSTSMASTVDFLNAAISDSTGGLYGDVNDLEIDQIDDLGELLDILGSLGELDLEELQPILDQFGIEDLSELQPILENLGVSDLNELNELMEELNVDDLSELNALMEQLEVDDLSELNEVVDQLEVEDVDELNSLIDEFDVDNLDELGDLAERWTY